MILITGNVLVPFVLSVFMLEDIYLSLRSMTDFGPFVDAVPLKASSLSKLAIGSQKFKTYFGICTLG